MFDLGAMLLASPTSRHEAGDDLAVVAAVEVEIVVGGQNDGIGGNFGHADQASVGQAHWHVGVFVHEIEHRNELRLKFEGKP